MNKSTLKPGKYCTCLGNSRILSCNQVKTTLTVSSEQIQKTNKIFHEVNCFSAWVVYLMECTLSKKQYVGKAEIYFNISLNNHINDVKKIHPKTIFVCKHFQEKNHDFNKHAKFIIIDKVTNRKNLKKFCGDV